ncbi:hypothetical protein M1O29_03375 [Dehalococcoidia bacterium]|nr:hypothetical protein [Dehalococcoidia bacterium]
MTLSQRVDLDDSLEAVMDYLESEGASDGLPVIPPTPDRVEAMIATSHRKPDDIVGILPPRQGAATIEKIAINAVMAGCRPEYFPVVVAAVEATADPSFDLEGVNTTTNSATTLMVVNGPARDKLGINYGYSCFGFGGRANATIGRALRLSMLNIAGSIPGEVSKSTFGQPGRYSMCIGESEDMNPWAPLQVQRGYTKEDNTVTVFATSETTLITDVWSQSGEGYLLSIAHSIDSIAAAWVIVGRGDILIVLSPEWAEKIAKDFDLATMQQYLWENSRIPLDRFHPEHYGPLKDLGRLHSGDLVPLVQEPSHLVVIVAGGLNGLHSFACPSFGLQLSVTRPFTL